MTAFEFMHDPNYYQAYYMENYLSNASFLLGNNGLQQDYSITNDTNSSYSNNNCINNFDCLNQPMLTDIYTPDIATIYNEDFLPYAINQNDTMDDCFFLLTPATTVCSILPDESAIKIELDDPSYFPAQDQSQSPESALFDKSCCSPQLYQEFPNSPESMLSDALPLLSPKHETAAEQQPKAEAAKKEKTPRQKVFPCSYCNRSFARKYDAARHKRIHTGIKPYYCPCCNKGFARSDARVRHFRTEFKCRDGADKIPGKCRNHNQRRTAATSSNLCHL